MHCAGIEPATSCVVGEYSNHDSKPAVKFDKYNSVLSHIGERFGMVQAYFVQISRQINNNTDNG
jgi:hypothetical protein